MACDLAASWFGLGGAGVLLPGAGHHGDPGPRSALKPGPGTQDLGVFGQPGGVADHVGRGWPKGEMARRLVQAGRDTGDTAIPSTSTSTSTSTMLHNIHRWERGEGGLSERYKLHYCHALGILPSQFGPGKHDRRPATAAQAPAQALAILTGSPAAPQVPAAVRREDPRLPVSALVAYRGIHEPVMGDFTVDREVLMAAHEGSDHAEEYEDHGIGEATFEQLRADVVRLSRLSDTGLAPSRVPGHAAGALPDLPAAGPAAVAARADRPALPARLPEWPHGHHR